MDIFSGNHTCPLPEDEADMHIQADPIVGSLTFQHLAAIIAAASLGLTLFLTLWLVIKHLHRYTFPSQQRQIIRIILTPVVFGVCSFLQIVFYDASLYISAISDLYEVFALASIFLLFSDYVTPDYTLPQRLTFFNQLPAPSPRYQLKTVLVFTYVLISLICFIGIEASLATSTYCDTSLSPAFAHIWIMIVTNVSITFAVLSIVKLYTRLKPLSAFSSHSPLLKLISFKAIVGVNFIQSLIFSIIVGQNLIHGNHRTTGKDLTYGVPALITAIEQVCFAVFFHYSFRSREYHEDVLLKQGLQVNRKGTFEAALQAVNPMDIVMGVVIAVQLVISGGYKDGASMSKEKSFASAGGRYMQVEESMRTQHYQPYGGGRESVEGGRNETEMFLQPTNAPTAPMMERRSGSVSASPPLYQQAVGGNGTVEQGRYEGYRRERSKSRDGNGNGNGNGDYATGPRDMV